MNDWNSLENELRKWVPRPPSPELRARVFGPPPLVATAEAGASRIHLADLTRWIVPALGCFLLVLGTLSSRYPTQAVLPFRSTNFLSTDAGYNEIVLASSAEHSDKNSLPPARVEWSFGGRSNTGHLGALPVSFTNKIIQ